MKPYLDDPDVLLAELWVQMGRQADLKERNNMFQYLFRNILFSFNNVKMFIVKY